MKRAYLLTALLAGCTGNVRPTEPIEVVRTERVYVGVPDKFLQLHDAKPETDLAICPLVAEKRRTELEKCNVDKTKIGNIRGTKVN
jgi:hypothetical protein